MPLIEPLPGGRWVIPRLRKISQESIPAGALGPLWRLAHLSMDDRHIVEMWADIASVPRGEWRVFDQSDDAMDSYQKWRLKPIPRFTITINELQNLIRAGAGLQ
jgi:hypothetical protein